VTMARPEEMKDRWAALAVRVWAVVGIIILLAVAGTILGRLSSALVPFVIALVIVVLLRAPVEWLVARRVPRLVAVMVCYLAGIAAVTVGLVFIVPVLTAQIGAFLQDLPDQANHAYRLWLDVTEPSGRPVVPDWVTVIVLNIKDTAVASVGKWSGEGLAIAYAAGSQAVTAVIDVVLALIIAFYTLMDLPKLLEEALMVIPDRFHEESVHVVKTVAKTLGGWMRGAIIDSLIVGILIALGLWILGVPYAFAIGIIGGVLNIVPYLGPVVAAVLAGFSGLLAGNPWTAFFAVLVVFGVQQLDSLVLNPRIMADNVDLHPVLVVFSLLAGATLFGIGGMLLAVPVAAIGKGLFVYYFERRTQTSLARHDGALFRTPRSTGAGPSEDKTRRDDRDGTGDTQGDAGDGRDDA